MFRNWLTSIVNDPLKADVDKLDITKLQTVLVDLRKVRDVVENEIVREKSYCILVPKIAAIE